MHVAELSVHGGVLPAEFKHVAYLVPVEHCVDDPHLHEPPLQTLPVVRVLQASEVPHLHEPEVQVSVAQEQVEEVPQ